MEVAATGGGGARCRFLGNSGCAGLLTTEWNLPHGFSAVRGLSDSSWASAWWRLVALGILSSCGSSKTDGERLDWSERRLGLKCGLWQKPAPRGRSVWFGEDPPGLILNVPPGGASFVVLHSELPELPEQLEQCFAL